MSSEKNTHFQQELGVTEYALNELKKAKGNEARQEIIDRIFRPERKMHLLEEVPANGLDGCVSLDAGGRVPLYYRYMTWPRFIGLLEKGEHTADDYRNSADLVDLKNLKGLLWHYARFLKHPCFPTREIFEAFDLPTQLSALFTDPELIAGLTTVVNNPTYGNVVPFLERSLPAEFAQREHAAYTHSSLLTYLSMSVGGIIRYPRGKGAPDVQVEMLVPDDQIIVKPERTIGEKEVLIKRIPRDWILRAYTLPETLEAEVIRNPRTAIGQVWEEMYQKNEFRFDDLEEAVEEWRRRPTQDYLPKSRVQEYRRIY